MDQPRIAKPPSIKAKLDGSGTGARNSTPRKAVKVGAVASMEAREDAPVSVNPINVLPVVPKSTAFPLPSSVPAKPRTAVVVVPLLRSVYWSDQVPALSVHF